MKKEEVIKALDKHLDRWDRESNKEGWVCPQEIGVSIFNKDESISPVYAVTGYDYDIYIKKNVLTVYDYNADCYYAKERILLDDIKKIGFYQETREILGCYE